MIKKLSILFFLLVVFSVKSQEKRYTIKNLSINNHYSNFGTTFYGEDKVVYASPRKKSYIVRNVWKGNNQPFLDLFIGEMQENGQLKKVKKFSETINTRYHEADVAFTKDLRTVYFSRNNYLNRKFKKDSTGVNLIQLYRAKIRGGEWVDIEPMPFNSDQHQTGHPTLSADEKTLYFISDMPGSLGKTDVFKANINDDGSIGEPINLGPKINTTEREMFVSLSGNDELYFSSDGRDDGLGGLDIYVSQVTENNITEPENLGAPINSKKDDFSFILNYETRRGYFSSNRVNGKGDDDIYTFIQDIPIEFECKQIVNGVVTDKKSGEIIPGASVVLYDVKGEVVEKMIVGDDAKYNFELDCNESFKVEGSKEDFTIDTKEFYSTEGEAIDLPLALDSTLAEFVVERGNCVVKIKPIYFDFDQSYIRRDAAKELDKVVDVMRKYPDLIVEGGSHTDSRGSDSYNKSLSSRRANATVQYIISKGINPNSIKGKGYGETKLVNGCSNGVKCTDEEHEYNRRTEFVIINYEDIKDKYPDVCQFRTITTQEEIEEREREKEVVVAKEVYDNIPFDEEFEMVGNKIVVKIKPIYFEINSSYFRKDAVLELNKIIKLMKKYPNLLVECGSHTDSRASKKYNNWLSDRRAKRTAEYIISKGISSDKISSKGYGESEPLNHCTDGVKCIEIDHLKNRRTEFVILNPEIINR